EWLDAAALADREPHVQATRALLVPGTGIADFVGIARALAEELQAEGLAVRRHVALRGIDLDGAELRVRTSEGALHARYLVNCAGLHCDRVARMAGLDPPARIVPFRGEYYRLADRARGLVKHLVYPVPDPALPFLGVHLHRTLDGSVVAGPNAVLATSREGYRRRDVSPRDLGEVLAYRGFWRMARRLGKVGMGELLRATL